MHSVFNRLTHVLNQGVTYVLTQAPTPISYLLTSISRLPSSAPLPGQKAAVRTARLLFKLLFKLSRPASTQAPQAYRVRRC